MKNISPILLLLTLTISSCLCEGHEGFSKSDTLKITIPIKSIPINYQIGELIKVPIIINDSIYSSFILDNGTNILTFDSCFVAENEKSLRLSYDEKTMVRTFSLLGVRYQKAVFPIPDITIGTTSDNKNRIKTGKSFCVVGDLKTLSTKSAVSGILPLGLLRDKRFIYIDLINNYIQRLDSVNTDNYYEIPFTVDTQSGVFLSKLKLEIETKDTSAIIEGIFAIDFGFNRSIYLNNINSKYDELIDKEDYSSKSPFSIKTIKGNKISIVENLSGSGEKLILQKFPSAMSTSGFFGLDFFAKF